MSEADYQRGLRGGDCNVSISDYERWKDWKAGHDEYERRVDQEDEERIARYLTPKQQTERIDARIREREAQQARGSESEKDQARERIRRRASDRTGDRIGVVVGNFFAVCAGSIAGIVVGFVLSLMGVPFMLGFVVTLVLVCYFVFKDHAAGFDRDEARRLEEQRRDEAILRR